MKYLAHTCAVFFLINIFLSCGGERHLPVATGETAELSRCLKLSSKKKHEGAIECLVVFKSRYPGGNMAAEADLLIADSHYRRKEYLLAAETYQEFIRSNPVHSRVDYAYYRSGQAYMNANPGAIDRNQQYLDLAVKNFYTIVEFFPSSPYAKIANDKYREGLSRQAHKDYYVGRFYYKYGEYLAAISRFEEIVGKYPGVGYDEKGFYYLIDAYIKTDQSDRAREALLAFEERFPRSRLAKKAGRKLVQTH